MHTPHSDARYTWGKSLEASEATHTSAAVQRVATRRERHHTEKKKVRSVKSSPQFTAHSAFLKFHPDACSFLVAPCCQAETHTPARVARVEIQKARYQRLELNNR